MWREDVIRDALSWQDTPYVPKARLKGVGVDCGGLLYEVYNPYFGPFPAFPTDYSPDWANHSETPKYLDFILPLCEEVRRAIPGDFSLIHLGKHYSHAAILLDNGRYIHAWGRLREGRVTQSAVRVVEHLAKQNGFPLRHFRPKEK